MIKLKKILSIIDLNYFIKNGFWLYQSYLISLLTGFLLTFSYGNFLSKQTFGEFSFVLAVFSAINSFSLVGMGQALTHGFIRGFWGNYRVAIKQTLIFSLIGTIILIVLAIYYRSNLNLTFSFIYLALIFPFNAISTYYQSILISQHRFKYISAVNSISSLSTVLIVIMAIFIQPSLFVLILASTLPPLSINLVLSWKFRQSSKAVDYTYIKLGWHLSITQAINFLTKSIDKILLGLLLPFENLALYSFALIIPDQMYPLVRQIIILITPRISSLAKSKLKRKILISFFSVLLILAIGIFFYIILAPFIFQLFFPKFTQSINLSQIYSLSLLSIPTTLLTLTFQRLKKNQIFYLQELTLLILLVIFLWLLVPKYGIIGAVLAQVLSRMIYLLISFIGFLKIVM